MDTEQAVRDITAVLLGIKKQNFQHTKAEQLDETKKEISRERYRKKVEDRATSRSNRWNLPRIECEAESAVKLLYCKGRIERYILELAGEIASIKPTVAGDYIRGSNKLTARYNMSRMPYLATKRERKLINGLKQDWNHEEAGINEQTQEILNKAPKDILESENIGIEVENYLKTGVWREHSIEPILNELLVEEDIDEEEESYYSSEFSSEEREIVTELNKEKEKEALSEEDRSKRQNQFTLSYFYREWTAAHADLQLIRIAMELCRPDTRAYAEQMLFRRGKATHVVDAANQDMTFLHGRECNEEAIQAMLYVIGLHGMATRLNTHPQDEMIETVHIKMDGEEKVVPLTFDLIKLIAAEKVLLCPDYPWYQCLPVEGYGPEIEEKLLNEILSIETGEDEWAKRGPDARPLSGIHEYQDMDNQSIKDVYVNSKARNAMMQESADRIKDEQCLTTPSEILVAGVGVLLRRVCAFESAVITRFEQEIDNLPEKERMVLRQLYMEGKNFRELTDFSGKPLSKNSTSRWNKRGLKTIQERMEENPLSIRG